MLEDVRVTEMEVSGEVDFVCHIQNVFVRLSTIIVSEKQKCYILTARKFRFMTQSGEKTLILQQKIAKVMTEIHKKYRLTSMEEPTDEMLQELMEDVAKAARESSARAEAEKQRRLQTVANEIEAWRKNANV